jgi:hypothetical protein
MVSALWIINGIASVIFHKPCFVSPVICPTRSTVAVIPVFSAAFLITCSVTNFERA